MKSQWEILFINAQSNTDQMQWITSCWFDNNVKNHSATDTVHVSCMAESLPGRFFQKKKKKKTP